jgi:hypothetical protein
LIRKLQTDLQTDSTTMNDCIKPWITAPRARCSRKRCPLPSFGAGEKPLALSAQRRHNEALNLGRILYLKIARSLLQ